MDSRIQVAGGHVGVKRTRKGTEFWQGRLRYRVDDGEWREKAFTLKELDGKEIPTPTKARPNQGKATAERALRALREDFIKELERELDKPEGMEATRSDYASMDIPAFASLVIDGLEDGSIQRHGKELAPSTIRDYRGQLKHLRHYFGGLKVCELTPRHIDAMKADMVRRAKEGERMGQSVRRKAYMLLQQVYGFAQYWDVIERNPFDKTAAPSPQRGRPHPLDEAGFKALCATLEAAPLTEFSIGVRLSLVAGLREGEVCGLMWRDVDLKRRELDIQRQIRETRGRGWGPGVPKTPGSVRIVPMADALCKAVSEWRGMVEAGRESRGLSLSPSDYVIGTVEGFMVPQELSRRYRAYAEAHGLKDTNGKRATFHGLRDTFATRAIASGADVKAVSAILGHESVLMTLDRYADAMPKAKRDAVDGATLWEP